MKLIDKDTVIAELERRRDAALMRQRNLEAIGQETVLNEMVAFNLTKIISFLDTIEVKEVDLEEELESFAYTLPHSAIGDGERLGKFDDPKVKEARKHGWSHLWRYNYVKEIAKHFFELGMAVGNKAQKGE